MTEVVDSSVPTAGSGNVRSLVDRLSKEIGSGPTSGRNASGNGAAENVTLRKCKINGHVGVVPENYVEIIQSNNTNTSLITIDPSDDHNDNTNASPTSPASNQLIQPKKVRGVGYAPLLGTLPVHLRSVNTGAKPGAMSTTGNAPVNNNNKDESSNEQMNPNAGKRTTLSDFGSAGMFSESGKIGNEKINKDPLFHVRVHYPYTAGNEDEISLTTGDSVAVLKTDCEDDGWWFGKLPNGTTGMFPNNFVTRIDAGAASGSSTGPGPGASDYRPLGSAGSSADSVTKLDASGSRSAKTAEEGGANAAPARPPPVIGWAPVAPIKPARPVPPAPGPKPAIHIGTRSNRSTTPEPHRSDKRSAPVPATLPVEKSAPKTNLFSAAANDEQCRDEDTGSDVRPIGKKPALFGAAQGQAAALFSRFKPTNKEKDADKSETPPTRPSPAKSEDGAVNSDERTSATSGSNDRLQHLTANRAKPQQQKRPPSAIFLREKKTTSTVFDETVPVNSAENYSPPAPIPTPVPAASMKAIPERNPPIMSTGFSSSGTVPRAEFEALKSEFAEFRRATNAAMADLRRQLTEAKLHSGL